MRVSGRFIILLMMIVGMTSGSCQAFMLGGTRLVLSQKEAATSIKVISGSNDPVYLIQSRVTRSVHDNQADTNFIVTPPLFRLEQGARNELRISVVNGRAMPADRESLYYLKVTGIPSTNPLSRKGSTGYVSGARLLIGTGNVIKLFYRPSGLGKPDDHLGERLQFTRVPGGVQVTNPTPWYVNFSTLAVDRHPVMFDDSHPSVLPPFGKQVVGTKSELKKQARWSVLNDDGKAINGVTRIQ